MNGGSNSICDHQDVLTEILLRLPVRALIKFKCVSKQWRSLISDPDFCHSHNRRIQKLHTQKPNQSLLLYSSPTRLSLLHLKDESASISLPCLDYLKVRSLTMLDSRNGLILFGGYPRDYASDDDDGIGDERRYWLFVCNPVTRQSRTLFTSGKYHKFMLAFDPCKSPHYKVVVLIGGLTDMLTVKYIRIYCSASNSWRLVDCSDVKCPEYVSTGVYFNGSIYWPSNVESSLSFDVDTERFKILPMPSISMLESGTRQSRGVRYLRASCGHLFMVYHISYASCKVLELASDCSGWFPRYCVDLSSLNPGRRPIWIMIESIVIGEREEDTMVVTEVGCAALSYNILDRTTKIVCDRFQSELGLNQYFETLFHVSA